MTKRVKPEQRFSMERDGFFGNTPSLTATASAITGSLEIRYRMQNNRIHWCFYNEK